MVLRMWMDGWVGIGGWVGGFGWAGGWMGWLWVIGFGWAGGWMGGYGWITERIGWWVGGWIDRMDDAHITTDKHIKKKIDT